MNNQTEQYIKTFQKMIQAETVSQTDLEKFRQFHGLLKELFPSLFAKLEVEEFSGSLLMRWPGRSSAHPVLLMSHHDVVEASGEWTHPPFSAEVSDGKIWGRGTLDTKNNLWAMLQAAEELAAEGYVPATDIWFESACNEETSGSGADAISAELLSRGIHFDFVIDEGGYILHDPIGGADHDFAVIGVGEKGCADLKFTARSKGGHASMPGRNTPLVRLGKFMAAVEKSDIFTLEMSDTTAELFRRMAPFMKGAMGAAFSNIGKLKPLMTAVMPKVSAPAGALLKTTLAFTMAGGSEAPNVLPQEAYVIGDMRFSHHQGQKKSIDAVRALAEKYDVETEVLNSGFESAVSDYRSAEFKNLEQAVRQVFPDAQPVPYVMTGASDCRFFSRVSDNCFRFAPFKISAAQLASIHGVDENIDIEVLAPAVEFFRRIITGREDIEK